MTNTLSQQTHFWRYILQSTSELFWFCDRYFRRQNMTFSIKLRLMSPGRHTKPTVTGLQHTSLGCEEGKCVSIITSPARTLPQEVWDITPGSMWLCFQPHWISSIRTMSLLCQAHFTHVEISLKTCNSLLPTEKFCQEWTVGFLQDFSISLSLRYKQTRSPILACRGGSWASK